MLWTSLAWALEVPEKPQGYVSDYAGMLSVSAKQTLEEKLGAFEKETSNQVVVAVFKSLEGGSLEDFSIRLADKWKIGTKDKDNGVILLIFKDDRKVRIEVGYGLEGALPDATAHAIIQERIVPAFRAGDFDGGVISAVDAIFAATKGEYQAAKARYGGGNAENAAPFVFFALVAYFLLPILCYALIFVICFLFLGAPAGLILAAVLVAFLEIMRRLMAPALFGEVLRGKGRHGGFWSGGGGFSGGGFSGGGGGFSGGGGGSFGGGGSSGSW